MSHMAYVGFGSNLGERKAKFYEALDAIGRLPGTSVKARSRLYETEPKGLSDNGGDFINAALALETILSPQELLEHLRRIEWRLGKSPGHRSDLSHVIDLDLLLYDEFEIHDNGLDVPHPRLHERAFVLVPLAEIASHVVHPILSQTILALKERLPKKELEGVRALNPYFGPAKAEPSGV